MPSDSPSLAVPTQEPASAGAPHGLCECVLGCQCQIIRGPAAFQVERNGRTLKVCTRCNLSGDRNQKLLVGMNDPMRVFMNYDPLGAMAIAFELSEQAPAVSP